MRLSIVGAATVLVVAVVLAILLPSVPHGRCYCPFNGCCPVDHRIALRIEIGVAGLVVGAAMLALGRQLVARPN